MNDKWWHTPAITTANAVDRQAITIFKVFISSNSFSRFSQLRWKEKPFFDCHFSIIKNIILINRFVFIRRKEQFKCFNFLIAKLLNWLWFNVVQWMDWKGVHCIVCFSLFIIIIWQSQRLNDSENRKKTVFACVQ